MFNVGEIEVLRVEESLGPRLSAASAAARLERQGHRAASALAGADLLRSRRRTSSSSSIHSWVLKTKHHTILIDTCVGNHKERPGQPRFHMLNRPYMENFAKAGPEGGGHRLRALHAPACRPCGLEHAARQRPLGADVPERQVRVLQDRSRLLRSGARRGRQGGQACARVQRQRAAHPGSQAGHAGRRHAEAGRRPYDLAGAGTLARARADHAAVQGHRSAVHRRHHAQPDPDLSSAVEQRLLLRSRAGAAHAAARARARVGQGQPALSAATSPGRTSAGWAKGRAVLPTCQAGARPAIRGHEL